ncbi:hypothetical protein [Prevotella pallens]|uniref:hypothetical protein n=1 Tax=Prevotella pallens TaxID=60133 RepID=UPI0028DBE223|nr:hypothetical protein [Prevotella pallens]
MAQELVTKIRLDDKQFKSIIDKVKGEVASTENTFKSSSGNIKAELKGIQAELSNMLLNGVDPSSAKFQELAARAGSIKDAMGDASAVVKDFANDTRGLAGTLNIASSGVSIFQTYAGALAMFGVESDNTKEILAQLAGAMSVLNGIQTLQATFMDQSTGTYRAWHSLLQLIGVEQNNVAASTSTNSAAIASNSGVVSANSVAIEANAVAEKANSVSVSDNTAAITGNITATEGHTVAKGSETVAQEANAVATTAGKEATQGMTIAQKAAAMASKGLRIALSSIGIGLLISAIGYLISNWKEVVGWFTKTFPILNNLGGAFDRIKQIAAGVGNSILKFVVTPFKVLASVINDALSGNWGSLAGNAKKVAAEGINIKENYKEGVKWQKKEQAGRDAANKKKADLQKLDDDFKSKERQGRVTAKDKLAYYQRRAKLETDPTKKKEAEDYAIKAQDDIKKEAQKAAKPKKLKVKKPKVAKPKKDNSASKAKQEQEQLKATLLNNGNQLEKTSRDIAKNELDAQRKAVDEVAILTSKGLFDRITYYDDYYTQREQQIEDEKAADIEAINYKYAELAKKAHGNLELEKQISEQKAQELDNLTSKYLSTYQTLNAERAKSIAKAQDELKEVNEKGVKPIRDEVKKMLDNLKGSSFEIAIDFDLDTATLEQLIELKKKAFDNTEQKKSIDDLNSAIERFSNGSIRSFLDDARALSLLFSNKQASDTDKMAASMVAMGSALTQLGEDSAAAKAGLILSAIGQIVLGFAQATAQESKLGVWGWIAAIASGIGVMATTISQIKGFSQGGIFSGNSVVGDNNIARVNSGEMILTKTQQSNLFRLLDNNTAAGGNVSAGTVRVKGSDLYIALSNYSKVKSKVGKFTGIK